MKVQTIDVGQFEQSVFFSLCLRSPSFKTKVRDKAALQSYLAMLAHESEGTVNPSAVQSGNGGNGDGSKTTTTTKRIIQSEHLDKIIEHLSATKARLCGPFGKALPSRVKEGLFVLKRDFVQEYEDIITAAKTELREELLPPFLDDYQNAINRARLDPVSEGGLGPLWDARDYPPVQRLAGMFSIESQWLALGVPEGLPEALRAEAAARLENQLTVAADEIKDGLRESFQQLIAHAVERLTVQPGEKAKVFRDSLLENIQGFLDVFSARNLMNDTDLETLVNRARAVMVPEGGKAVSADRLRTFQNVREQTRSQFAEIQAQLDTMITERRSRKFNLE